MSSASIKEFQHLRISLQDLKSATNDFAETNCIGRGGFGKVYKGEIFLSGVLNAVAIKRLDRTFGQGTPEFWKEVLFLSQYKHENLVSLLGFCDENGENLLVYKYLSNRSLDLYLNSVNLSLSQRLVICVEAAMGLQYLHEPLEGSQQRVLHRDIKSANILLDHNWRAKIADFGLSKLSPANQQFSFAYSGVVGTMGYCDPVYAQKGFLTKESDVYSFGVVLFEVLCGRPSEQNYYSYNDIRRYLIALSRECYEKKKMYSIIHVGLQGHISLKCLEKFSTIAYRCTHIERAKRPTMDEVVKELKFALLDQVRFEIFSLAGSCMPSECGGMRNRTGEMGDSLACLNESIVGDHVVGQQVADNAVPVLFLVFGS
uniref:probable receptor-like protein kinase At5g38990 n=1 Tax=Erigeron canadensis TaxID=72917 RepID=UPI001CB96D50|nr:probable receptor-like protein kinase At5g38990 [Erigeron canadensis]